MAVFDEYLSKIDNIAHRTKLSNLLEWITNEYPKLGHVVKWNQPMFTDHGTFIIGFSVAKDHLSVAPELAGMDKIAPVLQERGIDRTKMLIKFPWDKEVDLDVIKQIIDFNIADKADCEGFWRK